MAIGRGRRRENPQPTCCTTTKKKGRKKKYGEKSTGKNPVTSGGKGPNRADIANFRLRMRIAYFRTWPFPVT